jgi:hypothetical protein
MIVDRRRVPTMASCPETQKERFLSQLGSELIGYAQELALPLGELLQGVKQRPWVALWPKSCIGRKRHAVWLAPYSPGSTALVVHLTTHWLDRTLQEQGKLGGRFLAWIGRNATVVNARDGRHIAHSMSFDLLPDCIQEAIRFQLAEHNERERPPPGGP